MPNLERFRMPKVQPLYLLLWIIAIINYFEILYHITMFFKNDALYPGNLICVTFYTAWTCCAVFFCILGVEGIREHKPYLLREYCVRYFVCSAILKTIFGILLLVLDTNTFFEFIEYASSEPLLYILVIRFTNSHAPVSLASCHVFAVVFILFVTFLVHRYGNGMPKRPSNIVARDIPLPEEFTMVE